MSSNITLLLIISTILSVVHAECETQQFLKCQETFSQSLGVDTSYNWNDPEGLGRQIENIYANGRKSKTDEKGIIGVCNSYNVFMECLDKNNFTANDCFNPRFILKSMVKPDESYMYSSLMNMIQYQCGAGFYPAIDNWNCLQTLYQKQSDKISACVRDFNQNSKYDPSKACQHVEKGMQCWSSIVRGCGQVPQFYACESFKEYTIPKYNYCSASCVV